MDEESRPGDTIRADIQGDVSGQVAVGKDIIQQQWIGQKPVVKEEEVAELEQQLADLREAVRKQAPPEEREKALERIDELEEAATAQEQDVTTITTMEYVRNWFGKNLPSLAEAVTGVIIHPVVGKLVGAAGDLAVAEFRRRFGGASTE